MESRDGITHKFYTAFARHDSLAMAQCYHPDVELRDPVFGKLKGSEVSDMWKMLIERSKGNLEIEFTVLSEDGHQGRAEWVATYIFSQTGKRVVNRISADFMIRDGLIFQHTDNFDLWKWSRQAFGVKGLLLGWTDFMQQKIRAQAQKALREYRTNIR